MNAKANVLFLLSAIGFHESLTSRVLRECAQVT